MGCGALRKKGNPWKLQPRKKERSSGKRGAAQQRGCRIPAHRLTHFAPAGLSKNPQGKKGKVVFKLGIAIILKTETKKREIGVIRCSKRIDAGHPKKKERNSCKGKKAKKSKKTKKNPDERTHGSANKLE